MQINHPSVSVVIPTLNSAKVIGRCLDSILMQDYPKEKIEFVFVDGGSTDGTTDLIKSKLNPLRYTLCPNLLRTGEAGKAVGVKNAKSEIIALIDSDNILPDKGWLKQMTEPFSDLEIVASEPLWYTHRKTDSYITRYCALLGMNDPVCLWMGNYDRYCALTDRWTEVANNSEDYGRYLKISFQDSTNIPTIGANGFLIRRDVLQKYQIGDYLFDIDIIYDLALNGRCKIAKVKTGIIHLYCDKMAQFVKKQKRRIKDYNYYNNLGMRKFPWDKIKKGKLAKFCLSTVCLLPVTFQATKGWFKTKDLAWFFHPVACWLTLLVYGFNTVKSLFSSVKIEDRKNWAR